MFINELFTRPTQWEYTKDLSHRLRAQFIIDTDEVYTYTVYMDMGSDLVLEGPTETFSDMWDISFSISTGRYDQYDEITGTGNAITVFSTVIDILEDAAKLKNMETLYFTASEQSRAKLYDRMAKHFANKGWRYIDDNEITARSRATIADGPHLFLLTKQPHPHEGK